MKRAKAGTKLRPAPGRLLLLASLTAGHAVVHWYQQSFFIILPEIKRDLELSPIQVGSLTAVRQFSGGLVNLPAGILSDMFRRRWSLILGISMAWIGLAYVLVGAAPSYGLVLVGMGLVGIGGAVWHPPAMAALSRRFADRRGFALAIHGVGGSIGDTVAPLAVGALLLVLTWRHLLEINFAPAVLLAFLVAWGLRGVSGQEGGKVSLRSSLDSLRGVLRNFPLMLLLVAGAFRGMGQAALFTFLPIYLRDNIGFSSQRLGLYLSLLTLMGMGSQPVLGFLADRFGRRVVLVPGLVALSLITLALVWAKTPLSIAVVVVLLGLFVYALQAVFLALAMDITRRGVEATTIGVLFGGNFLLSAGSPVIAGALVAAFHIEVAFMYVAALYLVSAVMISLLPLRRARARGAAAG